MQKITQSQWEFVKPSEHKSSKHSRAFYLCKLCGKTYERQSYPIEKGISKCCQSCSREANNACRWLIEFYGNVKKPITVYNLAKWARENDYPVKEVKNKSQGLIVGSVYGIRRITKLSD